MIIAKCPSFSLFFYAETIELFEKGDDPYDAQGFVGDVWMN
jgi:hypothetical protein